MKLSDSQEPRSVYTVIAPTRVTNDAHGFRRLQCLDPAANLLWERRTAFQRKMRLLDCRIGASREIRMDNTIPRMGCGAFDDTFECMGGQPTALSMEIGMVRIYYIQCCVQVYPEADHMNK